MFSVLIQFHDGHETLDASNEIEWVTGVLTVGDREYTLARGDVAYVMNDTGATVRKYGSRG